MIRSIIVFAASPGDEAARAAVARARWRYRVFTIVAALPNREPALEVAKDDAVTRVGKRTACFDEGEGGASFFW